MPPDDADSRLRPRPISRPRGTNKPGHISKPGGTNKPGHGHGSRPRGTNKPGHGHDSRPSGTNKPGHGAVPSALEDDRLTTNWIQYTERLKPGYSSERYA